MVALAQLFKLSAENSAIDQMVNKVEVQIDK